MRPRNTVFALAAVAIALGVGARSIAMAAVTPTAAPAALIAAIPARPADAPGASELLRHLEGLSANEQRKILVAQMLAGNVPQFLRELRPIELVSPRAPAPEGLRARLWVMPDYLAVGSDEDYLRIPLGLDDALEVARCFGFALPTRRMVDQIYRQAECKLAPQPLAPGAAMTSIEYIARHDRAIAERLAASQLGALVAGGKKDLVLSPRMADLPGRVAIYGWHRPDGSPIQPLSLVHGSAYADYSHGVRLVSRTVEVNGKQRSLFELLEDPQLAPLLSDEGVNPIAGRALLARSPNEARIAMRGTARLSAR